MDRRTFIQGVSAVGAITLLPTIAKTRKDGPKTAAELTTFLNSRFTARTGPKRAYFELNGTQYDYVTFVAAVERGDSEAAEAQLAHYFYTEFNKLPVSPLVWRREPYFESVHVVTFGDTWLSAEEIEDKVWQYEQRPDGRTIRNRKIKLVLPEHVGMDFCTGNYRYITGDYVLHKMRMRLLLPSIHTLPTQLHKAEGATINRI